MSGNNMDKKQFQKFVKSILDVAFCPHCNSAYSENDVQYLGEIDAMSLLRLSCPQCQAPALVSVAFTRDGEQLEGLSVTKKSNRREKAEEAVDYNDVIDTHNFMKGFDGNFENLFHAS